MIRKFILIFFTIEVDFFFSNYYALKNILFEINKTYKATPDVTHLILVKEIDKIKKPSLILNLANENDAS